MAKRRTKKRRKPSFPTGRLSKKRYFCRKMKPKDCVIKIGKSRYGSAHGCITKPVTVCPSRRGRKRKYTMTVASGSETLIKVRRAKRRHARR